MIEEDGLLRRPSRLASIISALPSEVEFFVEGVKITASDIEPLTPIYLDLVVCIRINEVTISEE